MKRLLIAFLILGSSISRANEKNSIGGFLDGFGRGCGSRVSYERKTAGTGVYIHEFTFDRVETIKFNLRIKFPLPICNITFVYTGLHSPAIVRAYIDWGGASVDSRFTPALFSSINNSLDVSAYGLDANYSKGVVIEKSDNMRFGEALRFRLFAKPIRNSSAGESIESQTVPATFPIEIKRIIFRVISSQPMDLDQINVY